MVGIFFWLILKRNKLVIGINSAFILDKNILADNGIPSGIIAIWSGTSTNIPTGWVLCDGNNNTPDLRNRFIVGAGGSYLVGNTGGESSHQLTIGEMPSHNHGANLSLSGLQVGIKWALEPGGSDPSGLPYYLGKSNDGGTRDGVGYHSVSGNGSISINSTGSNQAHNNMPPYYALCYIMKV